MSDIHYKNDLIFDQQIELMRYVHSICKVWIYEELDCSKSFLRQPIEKNFEDALNIFKEHKTHFCVVLRGVMQHNKYLEISMSDFKNPSSFLWVHLDHSHIPEICKNFKIVQ